MVRLDTTSIDGLRGLAALHIAFGHCLMASQGTTNSIDLMGGASMGLFFIISGFVLTIGYGNKADKVVFLEQKLKLIDQKNQSIEEGGDLVKTQRVIGSNTIPLYEFWIKRLARLAPTYYLTSFLVLPIYFLVHTNFMQKEILLSCILSIFGITSWSTILDVRPLNGVLWTVSTMLFFYLVYPFVVPLMKKLESYNSYRRLALHMYILQIIIFLIFYALFFCIDRTVNTMYWPWRMFPPARLPIFIMGCCLGYIRVKKRDTTSLNTSDTIESTVIPLAYTFNAKPIIFDTNATTQIPLVFVIVVAVGTYFTATDQYDYGRTVRILSELFMPILYYDWIIAMTKHNRNYPGDYSITERIFRSSPLQFLGKTSMSFYMSHMMVLRYFQIFLMLSINDRQLYHLHDKHEILIPWWGIFIVLPLAILIGWFMTEFFEKPMQGIIISFFFSVKKENSFDIVKSKGAYKSLNKINSEVEVNYEEDTCIAVNVKKAEYKPMNLETEKV